MISIEKRDIFLMLKFIFIPFQALPQKCYVCRKTARYFRGWVEEHWQDIDVHLKIACDFLPVAYLNKCKNRVSDNIRDILHELLAITNPGWVCPMLGMCPRRKIDGISNIKHPDWLIARGHHGDVDVN